MVPSLEHLQHCQAKGNVFLLRIVAGDEMWCHHLQHMGKCNRNTHPLTTLRNSNSSPNHLWGRSFFNISGPLMSVFMGPDITINEQRYCGTLQDLVPPSRESILAFSQGVFSC
jgi:hypothetical protein